MIRLKSYSLLILTHLSIILLALLGILNIRMYNQQIDNIDNLYSLIILASLLFSIITRHLKTNKISLVALITADLFLIGFTFGMIIADSFTETLRNFFVEPGITLILFAYVAIIFDWINRIKKNSKLRKQLHQDGRL